MNAAFRFLKKFMYSLTNNDFCFFWKLSFLTYKDVSIYFYSRKLLVKVL